jgi:hypothetical protein
MACCASALLPAQNKPATARQSLRRERPEFNRFCMRCKYATNTPDRPRNGQSPNEKDGLRRPGQPTEAVQQSKDR